MKCSVNELQFQCGSSVSDSLSADCSRKFTVCFINAAKRHGSQWPQWLVAGICVQW